MYNSKGRSSGIVAAVVVCLLLIHSAPVRAETYRVGGALGWTFGVVNWPIGKTFKAGDVLDFEYVELLHNVVEVDKNGYDNCKASAGAKVYNSGSDKITLKKGVNSFISTLGNDCLLGMRITLSAL